MPNFHLTVLESPRRHPGGGGDPLLCLGGHALGVACWHICGLVDPSLTEQGQGYRSARLGDQRRRKGWCLVFGWKLDQVGNQGLGMLTNMFSP